jgi:large subunit ribosomal protein L35
MAKMKLKTNRSAAKRLKVSGSGKIMRRKGWKRHLLTVKSAARKRSLSGAFEVDKDNTANIKRLIPYGVD